MDGNFIGLFIVIPVFVLFFCYASLHGTKNGMKVFGIIFLFLTIIYAIYVHYNDPGFCGMDYLFTLYTELIAFLIFSVIYRLFNKS